MTKVMKKNVYTLNMPHFFPIFPLNRSYNKLIIGNKYSLFNYIKLVIFM